MHRKLQFLRIGSIQLISRVITTCVAIILAYKGFGYYAIITQAVLGSIIIYVLSLILCKTHYGLALDKHTFKNIFSFSGWLMASVLFRNLSHQIDRLLMPRLLSVSALGSYNRPKEFIEQISSKLNGIFDSALFPVLSSLQDNQHALNSAFRRAMFVMNVFALLLVLFFVFNSGLLIRIFFGEQWMNLQQLMMVCSCALLFNIDGRLADCFFRSLAMTKQQFFFRIFEFALKTIGILIGFKMGIMGVALSIVISNFIAKIVKIIYIGGKVGAKPMQTISILLSSWRYALLMLPVCFVAFIFLPQTWGGDIAMAVIFVLITALVFLCMPNFVGKPYHDEVYVKTMSIAKQKLHVNRVSQQDKEINE